jgi:hypothetical protein
MNTVCHKQLSFKSLFGKEIIACFDGGRMTSDGGGLLLGEIDESYGVTSSAAFSIHDRRDRKRTLHDIVALLRQRIFSIALGYEDANDAHTLKSDPALKIMSGKLPETGADLASQPTISRFENRVTMSDLRRLADFLADLYIRTHPGSPPWIVLDMDATDDPTHGNQQLSFFHGYYERHMYHPLLIFDGLDGFPLAAILRPGNVHASKAVVSILRRLIKKLKKAYPRAHILLRADAGFAIPALYRFLEKHSISYVIGLITNNRLREKVAKLTVQAQQAFEQTGQKQRRFTSFRYKADSWRRSRRIIAKVEWLPKGRNQRFVVTNLSANAQIIYDDVYVMRGEAENRIKELKIDLKADRLSCHRFQANQFRLLLHTTAYCLFWLLRRHLQGTELSAAQAGTIRLKLLKIGARVSQTSRRVWLHMASSYPYQAIFAQAIENIRAAPI